jgi:putative transposase
MARLPRLYIPNETQHVVLDSIKGVQAFNADTDYQSFYDLLIIASKKHDLKIHAYALLPHKVHLLVTPGNAQSVPLTMQSVGRVYVAQYNRKYKSGGTLWQGRYRATVIDSDEWFMKCSVLIDKEYSNVVDVSNGRYSVRHHLGIINDPNLVNHEKYWALGNTTFERQHAYGFLLNAGITDLQRKTIMDYTNAGWVLGDEKYRNRVALLANRRIVQLQRGRPRKDGQPRSINPAYSVK